MAEIMSELGKLAAGETVSSSEAEACFIEDDSTEDDLADGGFVGASGAAGTGGLVEEPDVDSDDGGCDFSDSIVFSNC